MATEEDQVALTETANRVLISLGELIKARDDLRPLMMREDTRCVATAAAHAMDDAMFHTGKLLGMLCLAASSEDRRPGRMPSTEPVPEHTTDSVGDVIALDNAHPDPAINSEITHV